MSYLYYILPAAITFLVALYAFFKDAAASKTSVLNWSFVIVAGLLWPITLPFIVWEKLSAVFKQGQVGQIFTWRGPSVKHQSHIV